ncbi:hypothetical protein POF50_027445 [Streptomyces sp. SL13]|uniref:Uncharacterized protein n=1 Tax=Streptantibioticus silvisoli TaxID=2705255 RepID=A0AA90H2S6_9ACTN|nr:hypothetical protein [Streptantibioticus silvisoli]MDI5966394.1 hypothetical protein [Streptantibioticus silvisoli]MDI5973038.1 hypothetical protein [Streptantibioticus silvisoli]
MAFGFAALARTETAAPLSRTLGPDDWTRRSVPLLGNPRELVKDLCARHLPSTGTAVVAVLGLDGRLVASASFASVSSRGDGWERRNAVLDHLRRVTTHDLRLRAPVRTGVLMVCREGGPNWMPADGAWMWGLSDACTLHGLRCGAYVTLSDGGWQVLGEGRSGRTPHAGSWTARPVPNAWSGGPTAMPDAPRRHVAR